MAGELALHKIILNDNWPGEVNPNLGIPTGGWDSTSVPVAVRSACVCVAAYPPGTKIRAYSDGSKAYGTYTMCYLRFVEGSDFAQDIGDVSDSLALVARSAQDQTDAQALIDGSNGDCTVSQWWNVTNDFSASEATQDSLAAVATAAFSTGEYGWYWVGGVCPYKDVTMFDDSATADSGAELQGEGNIVAGSPLMFTDHTASAGYLMLIPWESTTPIVGWALEKDGD